MPLVADRVKETTTTAGTGTLTLAGAATGFQSFSAAFGTGAVVYYVIAAGADWEIGIGTTGSGTLSRDTVLQSSNGDALVDWPAGTKDVFCAYVADRAVTTSDPATLTNKTIDSVTNFVGANQLHLKAKATENLAKGDVCKVTGWNAGENAIEVAKVSSPSDIAIGATDAVINIGDIGTVVNTGTIEGLNTNAYAIGTILYPNTSGGFTSSKPASGQYQACAFVLRQQSVNGVVYVEFTNPQYVEVATNTANTLVLRDGSGNFAAGTVTAALTGNASTATALSSSRTFALTGDVTGSVSSDLTSGASISTAIAAGVIVDADINASAAIADTKLATISTAGKVSNSATTAASASTASAIVARDANGSASFKNVKLDGTTSGTVTVQPAAAAGTWSLTLPTTAGSSGQVLSTDGSGVTSWATAGGTTQQAVTGDYNITAADAGKQLVLTGTTTAQNIFFPASTGTALTAGQTIEVVNASAYNNSFGGGQLWESNASQPTAPNAVPSFMRRYANGKILIVGAFSTPQQYIYRLNADGSTDGTFASLSFDQVVTAATITSDDAFIYIAGSFTTITYNGTTYSRQRIARLNGTTGALDLTWNAGGAGPTAPAETIAVSGTTVAVSGSFGSSLVLFYNTTTGTQLGSNWDGQYGEIYKWGFGQIPYLLAHPTSANVFIATTNAYFYYNENYEPVYFYNSMLHINTGGGALFNYNASGTIAGTPQSLIIGASNMIYTTNGSSVTRWVVGTANAAATGSASWPNGTVCVWQRPTDNAVFVSCQDNYTGSNLVNVFNGTTLANLTYPSVFGWGGSPMAGVSQTDGKILFTRAYVNGALRTLGRTIVSPEVGASLAYPPQMSGSTQQSGFTSSLSKVLNQYARIKIQKMPNNVLLVVDKTTPYNT